MALLCANGSRTATGPNRMFSGVTTVAGGHRKENVGVPHTKANWPVGEHAISGVTDRASVPDGARPPVAWVMARKAGGLSSHNEALPQFTVGSLTLAAGRNIEAVSAVTFTLPDAELQLVVSASGEAAIVFTVGANLAGSMAAAGSAAVAFTVGTPTLGALADLTATTSMAFTVGVVARALGHLEGDITPFTELSPQSLAEAVWQRVVEAGFTAEQMLRIIASYAAGEGTDLEGSNPRFTGLDGTTTRIDGTYVAGERGINSVDGS